MVFKNAKRMGYIWNQGKSYYLRVKSYYSESENNG